MPALSKKTAARKKAPRRKARASVRSVSKNKKNVKKGAARFQFFYAALFREKGEWATGEIVERAMAEKKTFGRGLSRSQAFRHLKTLETEDRIKKFGKHPLIKYRATESFKAWAAWAAAEPGPGQGPETIEIEGGGPWNESVAATRQGQVSVSKTAPAAFKNMPKEAPAGVPRERIETSDFFYSALFRDKKADILQTMELTAEAVKARARGGLGVSKATAERQLKKLLDRGFIRKAGRGKYKAEAEFKAWAEGRAPETIEIESAGPENPAESLSA